MTSLELADVLLAYGGHRVGPLVETYLAKLSDDGDISVSNPAQAFELLYGLVIRDTLIRVLLGEPPPSVDEIRQRSATAVGQFLALTQPAN